MGWCRRGGALRSGGLDLLVRCCRGPVLGGALPQGVSTCRCAASAGAGGGLRKGLDRAAGGGAGLGSRAVTRVEHQDLRSCVGLQGFCVSYGIPSPTQKRSTSGARMKNRGCPLRLGGREILPSREPFHAKGESPPRPGRHRWICNRRSVSAVADPPIGRANAEPWPQNAEKKDRASKGELGPGPETRNQPQARCRSRPFRRPAPANGEAAQRQGQTPCGTAPAGPRPRRHRTSEVTTPAGSARPRPRPRVGRMNLRPGRSGDRPGGGAGCGGRR